MAKGTLYIVSTPIGNLEDITFRAIRILKEVDFVAAEDTRRTNQLLAHYGIKQQVTSYHSYNIAGKTGRIVDRIAAGEDAALVSDSGTPGISDPGSVLIYECIKRSVPVFAAPGPSALLAALVVSGKDTSKFVFEGFLSNKKTRRRKQIEQLKDAGKTVILYESPHRITGFLEDFKDIMGERDVILARELTKKFEEVLRGPAEKHLEHFSGRKPKGEFVIIF